MNSTEVISSLFISTTRHLCHGIQASPIAFLLDFIDLTNFYNLVLLRDIFNFIWSSIVTGKDENAKHSLIKINFGYSAKTESNSPFIFDQICEIFR